MHKLKVFGLVVGGLVAVLVVALLAVWLFVNPNNYKVKIADLVKQSTGRELQLTGDIKLSVFPRIALGMGPATLGNLPGFGTEPFLSFARAAIRVELLPLLRQRLEISRIELDGLDLRLLKNSQGKGNWESSEPASKAADKSDTNGNPARSLDSLANVSVKNGRVAYENLVVENFNLETGSLTGAHMVPFDLRLDARRGVAGEAITLNAKFDLGADSVTQNIALDAVNLSGTVSQAGDEKPVQWEFASPKITANLDKQTLAIPTFAFGFAGANLSGTLSATKIIDALTATGSVSLAPLVLKEFAAQVGVALPKTRDPKAFSQFSASGEFAYDPKGVTLEKIQVRLDDTQLHGNVKFQSGQAATLKFDLTADNIDVDRYRAPFGTTSSPAQKTEKATPKSESRSLGLDGTLVLASAHAASLDFTNLKVTVAAKDKVTHLYPVEAQIDGGRYSGNITFDERTPIPTLNLDEHLTGVDMARLLANTSQKGRLSGRATVNIKATAKGAEADTILKTISGTLDANLADGAIEGLDLAYELNQAVALIDRKPAAPGGNSHRTKFETFKISSQIANGVAESHDLAITSQAFKVSGQGIANLSTQAISFQLLASVLKAPSTAIVDIPLKITGTYVDPTVRPDLEALAKGQLKNKLQDVLKKNGLEGLFK
jgi:AsmA protein